MFNDEDFFISLFPAGLVRELAVVVAVEASVTFWFVDAEKVQLTQFALFVLLLAFVHKLSVDLSMRSSANGKFSLIS